MKDVVVETTFGKVRGMTENGVHSFKGIPYGGPTGGPNRFMPPTPPEPWAGVRDATEYGPASWQTFMQFAPGIGIWGTDGIDSMSEDCLVLNIWTRGLNDQVKRPVMVWLHGGGFFLGSGDDNPCYNGASLARTWDVVVVTVNHRLGVFGYLHLGELAGEKYASSGNAGLLDLVAALKWVRDNIAMFGGDPGNVTIFGMSGGGVKVSALMAMPMAKGLFRRAIIESASCLRVKPPEMATRTTREFLDMIGVSVNRLSVLHEMRASMIYYAWMELPPSKGAPTGKDQFRPVVDGKILPAHPFDPVAAPSAADVPLIIGTNKDEMNLMLSEKPLFGSDDYEGICNVLRDNSVGFFGKDMTIEQVNDLVGSYRRKHQRATTMDVWTAFATLRTRMHSIRLAERKAAGGSAPVYMYLFTWESPALNGILKSCHTLEMPFVFNNVEPPIAMIGDAPQRFQLAERMSGAWAAFARSGNPNHKGIPHWPKYSTKERTTMIIDTEWRVENDPYGEERKEWDRLFYSKM